MKLISLNCMKGTFKDKLLEFVEGEKDSTQVFCLQEVSLELLVDLKNNLPDFECVQQQDEKYDCGCVAVFVKKTYKINSIFGKRLLWHWTLDEGVQVVDADIVQVVEIEKDGKKLVVINFHGIYGPGSKLDTPLRIEQSEKLLKILRKIGPVSTILIGDFNLEPKTKSIEMLSKKLVNLNEKFKVTDTRGEGNVKYWGKPNYQPYADYAFASEDLVVNSFEAKEVVVSDHKPLVVEGE